MTINMSHTSCFYLFFMITSKYHFSSFLIFLFFFTITRQCLTRLNFYNSNQFNRISSCSLPSTQYFGFSYRWSRIHFLWRSLFCTYPIFSRFLFLWLRLARVTTRPFFLKKYIIWWLWQIGNTQKDVLISHAILPMICPSPLKFEKKSSFCFPPFIKITKRSIVHVINKYWSHLAK